ncbi:MAG: indole-3-glycerol phosphate synthase TrpC [bacterium]|nr:indole-3-glycerol phosphate synthase TrpC [Candidatus Margulisiibacteriota bacterium]
MLLDDIIANKRLEIEKFKGIDLARFAQKVDLPRDFFAAFPKNKLSLIAEVKKASPSAGLICPAFDPVAIAKAYEQAGAAAISVLTDEKFFQGKIDYLKTVKEAVSLPVLRKDFIIDEAQIYEARIAGADAVLLIARILKDAELIKFLCTAHELGMRALVEVHNAAELERVLNTDAKIIGINNRDLDTLEIDLNNTLEIVKKYPQLKSRVLISESGIKSRAEIEALRGVGIAGVLIGETLMKSPDISTKIKELGL